MNRINRKLLLVSLAILAVVGLGLFLVNRYQISGFGGFYFERAREARDAGRYVEAVNHYRQAIQLGKRDFESHFELAQSLLKLNDPGASYMEGLLAGQFQSDRAENHRLLADSAMMMRSYSDAQRWADRSLESNSNDHEMLLLRARARVLLKDYQRATEDYELAIQNPAVPIEATVELATLYAEPLSSLEKAYEVIDLLIARDDSRVEHYVEHGKWYLDQYVKRTLFGARADLSEANRFIEIAQQDSKTAMSRFPDDPSGFVLAVRCANNSTRFSEALEIGLSALDKFHRSKDLYVLSAIAAKELGKTDEARVIIHKGMQQFANDRELLWEKAGLHLMLREFEEGRTTLESLERLNTPKPQLEFMEARYLVSEGKFSDAITRYEGLQAKMVDQPQLQKIVDLELARCFESIGDRAGQIQVLRRAASKDSSWLVAREQLALALLAVGRIDEATAEYMSIADPQKAPVGVSLNLARLLIRQNDPKELSKQDWARVDAILEGVEKAIGNQHDVAVVRAESLLAREQVEKAREVLSSLPANAASFSARILLEVNQRSWSQADQLISESKQAGFDSVELRHSQAMRIVLGNDPLTMGQEMEALVNTDESWTDAEILELKKEILPIALSSEEMNSLTDRLANDILETDRIDVTSWFAILNVQLRQRDGNGMRETLEQIEKLTGRNAIWNYGQALARVVEKDPSKDDMERAQQYLNQAALLRPDWADVPALSGTLYDRQGNLDAAILDYERAIELGWRKFEEAKRLLNLLMERGRYAEADAAIRRLSQNSSDLSNSMSTEASKISFRLGNLQRAVEKAEEAASISTKAEDFIWLSQIKMISKDNDGAEIALRQALERYGSEVTVQFAWINFLRRNARMDEARSAALKLESQLENPNEIQLLRLAEIFGILGMTEDRNRIIASIDASGLRSLAEVQGYFPFLNDKSSQSRIDYLERLINTDSPIDVVQWARRQLAIELVSQTGSPNYGKARKLLAANLEADSRSREDRKTMALISAVEKGNLDPSESLEIFEQLLREGWNPKPDEQFILGQLFIAKGDWTQGSRYFIQLANRTEDRNPDHLKTYVKLLLDRKDGREAELWLDVLRRDGVEDAETAELLARVRFRRGQYDELLRNLVGEEVSFPETEWFKATLSLRRRFELLNDYLTQLMTLLKEETEETERRKTAASRFAEEIERMKSSLESTPDFPGMFYAEQLLARSDFTNAVTAFERVIQESTPEELVAFADRFLICEDVPTEQVERLEKLFIDRVSSDNASLFRVVIARLKEMQGEFTGAESVYREVLKDNAKDAIVLNNLANLLALKGEKLKDALDMINQSIAVEGENAMLLDTRGVVHLKAGNLDEAVKDLKESVRQIPHPLLRYHLAWGLYESRQFAEAKAELKKALDTGLQPSMTHVLERRIYEKLIKDLITEKQ